LEALPEHPEALYNAGVALKELGRVEEALAVWHRFLQHHQTDALAVGAARNLNLAGDFRYRAFAVGRRFIVGPSPGFQEGTPSLDAQLAETLDAVGGTIQENDDLTLHIVTFLPENKELAEQRAKVAKRYVAENFPDIPPERVRTSWFDQAETVQIGGKTYQLEESINIFTAKAGGTGS
jgi:hypothetical protein